MNIWTLMFAIGLIWGSIGQLVLQINNANATALAFAALLISLLIFVVFRFSHDRKNKLTENKDIYEIIILGNLMFLFVIGAYVRFIASF